MTKLWKLNQLGQSVWYDNIRRALLDNGDLQSFIEAGVTGVTSNPSIFEKAIAGSALQTSCGQCMSGQTELTALSAWR